MVSVTTQWEWEGAAAVPVAPVVVATKAAVRGVLVVVTVAMGM